MAEILYEFISFSRYNGQNGRVILYIDFSNKGKNTLKRPIAHIFRQSKKKQLTVC